MSITTTKMGDEFLHILKLEVSSINWVIYKDRFALALDARGMMDHVDGTRVEPKESISEEIRANVKTRIDSNSGASELRR